MVAPARATPIQIAAITDEFSPDLDIALDAMQAAGVTGVELRTIQGTNIVDLPDVEMRRVVDAAARRDMPIVSLASPLLKCVLPERQRGETNGSSRTSLDRLSPSMISRGSRGASSSSPS